MEARTSKKKKKKVSAQISEDFIVSKNTFKRNRAGSVIRLAWQADTGNGLCAEQTQRLTAAEARETAPPPSSENEKDACLCVFRLFKRL